MYPQAQIASNPVHGSRIPPLASAPPVERQPHIINAKLELSRATARLTGIASDLMRRLQPILRIEPANSATGIPPQGSTNCALADEIIGEVNQLDRVAETLNGILSDLEV